MNIPSCAPSCKDISYEAQEKNPDRELSPILERRKDAQSEMTRKTPDDAIEWLLTNVDQKKPSTMRYQTDLLLALHFRAMCTPLPVVLFALCELVFRPEYVEPLHEELSNVLAASGGVFRSRR